MGQGAQELPISAQLESSVAAGGVTLLTSHRKDKALTKQSKKEG